MKHVVQQLRTGRLHPRTRSWRPHQPVTVQPVPEQRGRAVGQLAGCAHEPGQQHLVRRSDGRRRGCSSSRSTCSATWAPHLRDRVLRQRPQRSSGSADRTTRRSASAARSRRRSALAERQLPNPFTATRRAAVVVDQATLALAPAAAFHNASGQRPSGGRGYSRYNAPCSRWPAAGWVGQHSATPSVLKDNLIGESNTRRGRPALPVNNYNYVMGGRPARQA